MTCLLTNEEVERALTPQDAIAATESIYRELAEGKASIARAAKLICRPNRRSIPAFTTE